MVRQDGAWWELHRGMSRNSSASHCCYCRSSHPEEEPQTHPTPAFHTQEWMMAGAFPPWLFQLHCLLENKQSRTQPKQANVLSRVAFNSATKAGRQLEPCCYSKLPQLAWGRAAAGPPYAFPGVLGIFAHRGRNRGNFLGLATSLVSEGKFSDHFCNLRGREGDGGINDSSEQDL